MPTQTRERPDTARDTAGLSTPAQILLKLDGLFEPGESLRWLAMPQERLGGSPLELIAEGRADRVLRLLVRLEEGLPL